MRRGGRATGQAVGGVHRGRVTGWMIRRGVSRGGGAINGGGAAWFWCVVYIIGSSAFIAMPYSLAFIAMLCSLAFI